MNTTVTLRKANNDEITLTNVTKYSIGYKLIYIEYSEDDSPITMINDEGEETTVIPRVTRIRAFGREEFESFYLLDADENVLAKYPLSGECFARINCN